MITPEEFAEKVSSEGWKIRVKIDEENNPQSVRNKNELVIDLEAYKDMTDERAEELSRLEDEYSGINPKPVAPWEEDWKKTISASKGKYEDALCESLKSYIDFATIFCVTHPEEMKEYYKKEEQWKKNFEEWKNDTRRA